MQELEWGHSGLTELQIVEDMRVSTGCCSEVMR
jgi:hypothetical protein